MGRILPVRSNESSCEILFWLVNCRHVTKLSHLLWRHGVDNMADQSQPTVNYVLPVVTLCTTENRFKTNLAGTILHLVILAITVSSTPCNTCIFGQISNSLHIILLQIITQIWWARAWQNHMYAQWRLRSACASMQSDQSSLSMWRSFGSLAT